MRGILGDCLPATERKTIAESFERPKCKQFKFSIMCGSGGWQISGRSLGDLQWGLHSQVSTMRSLQFEFSTMRSLHWGFHNSSSLESLQGSWYSLTLYAIVAIRPMSTSRWVSLRSWGQGNLYHEFRRRMCQSPSSNSPFSRSTNCSEESNS